MRWSFGSGRLRSYSPSRVAPIWRVARRRPLPRPLPRPSCRSRVWPAAALRYDARFHVERRLTELGLFRGKADNKMRLGVCSRSGDIIEPLLKPQVGLPTGRPADRPTDRPTDRPRAG